MRLALTLCSSTLLCACALGSAGPMANDDDGSFTSAVGAATGGANTSGDMGPNNTTGGDNNTGGTSPDTTGAQGEDAGDTEGSGSGADAGAELVCPTAAAGSCASPTDLGEVAGNQDGAPITKSGTGSAWFRIKVSDDQSNRFVESAMGIGLTLSSSDPGVNYDLFLYRNGDTSCDDKPYASTKQNGTDEVDHIWNAVGPQLGEARNLTIEVRQVSANCGTWALEIQPHPCSNYSAPLGDTCATK